MGETCILVNVTKCEQLDFAHVGAATPREFSGNIAASSIVTWYLCSNRGDAITFIGDYNDERNLPLEIDLDEIKSWPDKTNQIIDELIVNGVLSDHGNSFEDEDDPENVYIRDLRNCWYDDKSR